MNQSKRLQKEKSKVTATALKNPQAPKFIQWSKQKQVNLEKHPLWAKRNISFHRGYPKISEYRIFVLGSSTMPYNKRINYSSKTSPLPRDPVNYYLSDIQDKTVIQCCDEVLKEIEKIIIEAEKNFSIQL